MSTNVMIDIETLAVTARATITQIAAVAFDMDGKIFSSFNTHIKAAGQQRLIDPDTVMWWMIQDEAARRTMVAGQNDAVPLKDALIALRKWMPEGAPTWSHGSDFDLVLIADACRQVGIQVPWHRRDVRDTRTLFALTGKRLEDLAPLKPGEVLHDAIADATRQAKAVVKAWQLIAFG